MDARLTPMMKQYLEIKKNFQGDILFFRMGDFYEMFFEDAHEASRILDIALTSRQNDVPMCGIPYHAADSYIARLIKAGKRVAICEQLESVPTTGTVVRRDVVRVITPGTLIESNLLQSDDNNFLASVIIDAGRIGLGFVDISTGDFFLTTVDRSMDLFRGEIVRYAPREAVICTGSDPEDDRFIDYCRDRGIPLTRLSDWMYDPAYLTGVICECYHIAGLGGLGLSSDLEIVTAGALLQYLRDTHRKAFNHLKYPQRLMAGDHMVLDDATIANMELVSNTADGSRNRTLFSTLDHTRTPMGRRTLERAILQPLLDQTAIEARLDIVQYFFEYHELTQSLRGELGAIKDIERLLSRFTLGRTLPRNFLSLRQSLEAGAVVKRILMDQPAELVGDLGARMPALVDLAARIAATIADEPALSPDQGRVVRPGFDGELDRIYALKDNARDWVVSYQEDEKKRLGLSTLKIRHNRILGYYIELSKAQAAELPADYLRKQTLVGNERFTTEKLQSFETEILTASERIVKHENEVIGALAAAIIEHQRECQELARLLGETDCYCSLAAAALENRYTRPVFSDDATTRIIDGRHPVVEKYYTREPFIPNDIALDADENIIKIITGPNMSGKSTYIRMAAMIQLMAQVGSFVPARSALLTTVDRIFTRIGASDNISRGESTFLVEMNETAGILNNATERSLIIMDEVGRGTSTYDGLSIAWAVVEYILRYLRARTLFATHYHELTQLGAKKGIVNYTVMVREGIHGVEFLHKVVCGSADRSYGIHVARLAGIPRPIVENATRILERLEKGKKALKMDQGDPVHTEQLEIFNAVNHRLLRRIKSINTETLTPLEALNELDQLKKMIESDLA